MDHETTDATARRLLRAFFDRRVEATSQIESADRVDAKVDEPPALSGLHLEVWPLPWQSG